jgi:hypothetical protein
MSVIRIGNACGFWGDSPAAPLRLAEQAPNLDVLTLDYLAEVSMSILAKQRRRNPALGYPLDLLDVIRSLVPIWKSGRNLKLITNGGGLNAIGCAHAAAAILREAGCPMKIGVVTGDDVLPALQDPAHRAAFTHLETGQPLGTAADSLITANAYLGAAPLVDALNGGAQIVIAGRVADPSLTVAPCISHFGWSPDDFNRIARATVAGHLIECGTQVTGGISTHWLELPDSADIGYPIVEVSPDGSCVVTKPTDTGGQVSDRTVKEQLLYELGDPANYLSPDAAVSFLSLRVEDLGNDRVRVSGATGRAPTTSYKVSATYRAGWRAVGMLTIVGHDAIPKARRAGRIVLENLNRSGCAPTESLVECLGAGDAAGGLLGKRDDLTETVLRISVRDDDKSIVERFAREIVPLVTSGPQGTTGYADGRPEVREVVGYWPTLIDRKLVRPAVEILEVR